MIFMRAWRSFRTSRSTTPGSALDLDPPPLWRSAPAIGLICGAWLVVIAISDAWIASRQVVLTIFLPIAPLLASAALGPLPTAAFAATACALAGLSRLWGPGGTQFWVRFAEVAVVAALAIFSAAARVRRERALQRSERIATVAQQALLPVLPTHMGRLSFATRYHSATRSAQVGGDFFDFVGDEKKIRLILGDISGKGIDAVTQAARVIRAFRQYGAAEADLLSVARRIHQYVLPFWQAETYATAVLVEVNDSPVYSVVSCGHPSPLLVSQGAVSDLPTQACLPLGIGPADAATTHDWHTGDRLLLYTDGLIEARSASGEFLPRRLIDQTLMIPSMDEALDGLLAAVEDHSGRFTDDLALLLMRRGPADDNPR
jgi:phosphoserine phosphatase RsbU/P